LRCRPADDFQAFDAVAVEASLQPGYARAERHLATPIRTCSGAEPLGLRFLRRSRLARAVEGDRLANERLEGGLVNFFSFVELG